MASVNWYEGSGAQGKEDIVEPSDDRDTVQHYMLEIDLAEKEHKRFWSRSKSILQRFTDKRDTEMSYGGYDAVSKLNLFWSNVQTLQPAVYNRIPKPVVTRRFKDRDPVGRVASQVLERATDYAINAIEFDSIMRLVRDDYLTIGRGSAWVRYVPHFAKEMKKERLYPQQISSDAPDLKDEAEDVQAEQKFVDSAGDTFAGQALFDEIGPFFEQEVEEKVWEEVAIDYVHWRDFLHAPCRVWPECRWVARRVFMTRTELVDRFGEEKGQKTALDHTPEAFKNTEEYDNYKNTDAYKKAVVWEVWDKPSRKVMWISKGYLEGPLDVQDDPLKLTEFFPCPKPLLSTTISESLIPMPDYLFYQDQAKEVDDLTGKINLLTKVIRVSGIFDGSCREIMRLMDEGAENELIPVPDWPTVAQAGGISGKVDFFPLQESINALSVLYDARERSKADLYEVTGISDIIRGYSSPAETATAQQIKGQFATLRLEDRQKKVAEFARDLIQICAEIIAEHFDPETMKLMSGTDMLESQEVPVLFEDAVALLRNDVLRSFRIDIETDSTIAIDEQAEKQQRSEFVQSAGTFLERALPVAQAVPSLAPFLGEMMMFFVRGFRAGRNLESSLENALTKLMEQQKQPPPPPPPDPAMVKIQAEAQIKAAELQLKQAELQLKAEDRRLKEAELKIKASMGDREADLAERKAAAELSVKREEGQIKGAVEAAKVRADLAIRERQLEASVLAGANGTPTDTPPVKVCTEPTQVNVEVQQPVCVNKKIVFGTDPKTGAKVAEIQPSDE